MIVESITVGSVLAVVISSIMVVFLYHYLGREYLGTVMIEKMRRILFPKLNPLDGFIGKRIPPRESERKLIRERGDEYILSVSCSQEELKDALNSYGYKNNYLSTLKYIQKDDEKVWESGTMAYRKPLTAKWMHHAYWFPASNEGCTFHISHHKERNYLDLPKGPSEHTKRGDEYFTVGDPDNHLRNALEKSDIEYEVLENEEY